MWHDSGIRRVLAAGLAMLLTVQVSGCSEWMAYQDPPAQVIAQRSPEKVRVELLDGAKFEVYAPMIVNDTLVGYPWKLGDATKAEAQIVRVPVADIRTMQVHQGNTGGTVVLAGLAIFLVVATAVTMPD